MGVTLRVRAIDETGAPVEGAVVRKDDETSTTTDADGVAMIGDIDAGFALVIVSHPMPAEAQLVFSLGEGSTGVMDRTVTLRRGAPLRGTVVAPNGAPLPDAMVEVWSSSGTRFFETEADGTWCVPAMLAGPYEVRASADGYARNGYARGRAIEGTHDGRTEQQGLVVPVAVGARLHGRVRDATGIPVVGERVHAEMMPGDDRSTTTGTDGRFEITGLGAGRHRVSVGSWRTGVVLPDDGGQLELDIELPAAEPVPDSSPDDSGDQEPESAPPPTASLRGRIVHDGKPVTQFAIKRKGLADRRWISPTAIIHSPDGRFALTELHELSFTVHVLALGCGWASTPTVVLEPGSMLDLGDIELPPGIRIAGIVCNADGAPIGGAHVTIDSPRHDDDPLSDAVEGRFATVSGSDGRFVFDGINIRDSRVGISAFHPSHGTSLEQSLSGSNDAIRLVLVPTGSIDGEVEPYDALRSGVIARAATRGGGVHVASVRPSGRFTIQHLIPGEYVLELVERPGWPPREARVTVIAGQRTHVRMPPP
jgi:hypothetical protein